MAKKDHNNAYYFVFSIRIVYYSYSLIKNNNTKNSSMLIGYYPAQIRHRMLSVRIYEVLSNFEDSVAHSKLRQRASILKSFLGLIFYYNCIKKSFIDNLTGIRYYLTM